MSRVEAYYDEHAQAEWKRLAELHRAEYDITLRALEEYLPAAPADLVDIGGGPGRYAIGLAQKGYRVTLVDLSQVHLELARQKAQEAGVDLQGFIHANAVDLSALSGKSFDSALLMGPLYHLLKEDERLAALAEALRLLKPGGLIFATFITRFAPFRDSAVNCNPVVVEDPAYGTRILNTGVHDNGVGFTDAYFAHPDEVIPFCERAGFTTIKLLGCEGVLSCHEDYVFSLTGEALQTWLDFNYRMAQEPSLFGASDHLLYIGRKAG